MTDLDCLRFNRLINQSLTSLTHLRIRRISCRSIHKIPTVGCSLKLDDLSCLVSSLHELFNTNRYAVSWNATRSWKLQREQLCRSFALVNLWNLLYSKSAPLYSRTLLAWLRFFRAHSRLAPAGTCWYCAWFAWQRKITMRTCLEVTICHGTVQSRATHEIYTGLFSHFSIADWNP